MGIFFVVTSAFFHAAWNVLLKKSDAKFRFNLDMHIVSLPIYALIALALFPDKIAFSLLDIAYGFIGAVFFTGYHLLVNKAYQLSDVSQAYPITTSSPLFVAVWALLFLGESLPPLALAGIVITVAGGLVLNGVSLKGIHFNKGIIAALSAAFVYSGGALFDKLGAEINAVMYTFWMLFFMTLFFAIHFILRGHREFSYRSNKKLLALAGFTVAASALTYRLGVMEMPISYAVAIRQVSGLFGVAMGIIFFKEGCPKTRFTGTAIMIFGITILRLA